MILHMASLLVFWWFSSHHHGWRPDPAPFFRGSTRCCRKTNEKRARQLRTTKLRDIKKLAEHLLGPELSKTIRDAEKMVQKLSRERSTDFQCRKEHRTIKQAERLLEFSVYRECTIYTKDLERCSDFPNFKRRGLFVRAIFKGPQRTTPETSRLYVMTRSGKKNVRSLWL
jgi:hypothetical protein